MWTTLVTPVEVADVWIHLCVLGQSRGMLSRLQVERPRKVQVASEEEQQGAAGSSGSPREIRYLPDPSPPDFAVSGCGIWRPIFALPQGEVPVSHYVWPTSLPYCRFLLSIGICMHELLV